MKFKFDELDTIPDNLHKYISKARGFEFDLNKTTYFKSIQQRFAGLKPKAIKRLINHGLNTLKQYIGEKQFDLI